MRGPQLSCDLNFKQSFGFMLQSMFHILHTIRFLKNYVIVNFLFRFVDL